ncbi:hypothetical protein TRFO_37246 [Tritrichomonas foetus]|uniref:Uncharacterized protein n=1 Tax=Tritrichomonas foetus TaxID=1144522 RepID=A0A1J4JBL5_9EUKA|nr:hypothetical protein TRFO_37246 [Tritrichomonas foetus]|eukprot:OHS96586.1 hypothetical protein TRFO_37246 [Tritrichomonas foetus]
MKGKRGSRLSACPINFLAFFDLFLCLARSAKSLLRAVMTASPLSVKISMSEIKEDVTDEVNCVLELLDEDLDDLSLLLSLLLLLRLLLSTDDDRLFSFLLCDFMSSLIGSFFEE